MTTAAPYRVLVVCTGNIARSPYVERLLRRGFADLAGRSGRPEWVTRVEIASAGVDPVLGAPMDPPMAELLRGRGIDPTGHVAQAVDPQLIAEVDLVLAATREHRREVVRLLPRASRRVFTLPEFARLLEDADEVGALGTAEVPTVAEALRLATAAAADRRGFAEAPEDPAVDDVDDPHRRSVETYARVAARLDGLVERITAVLERAVDRSAVGSGR